MQRNRLFANQEALRPSPGAEVPVDPNAFVAFPLLGQQPGGVLALWQQVYQIALERVRAVVRPSRWERCYAASRN
jgi:hypothetical protein